VSVGAGEVQVLASAKLTLSLRIVGVRDDGYHLIDAEMVSLSLHDVLTIDPDGEGLTIRGRHAAGVPGDGRNLVAKALERAGRTAAITIDKRIPNGGGLGGGSSDAAAVLRWAGIDDLGLAAQIGADAPFCLVGGRARVKGIGEIVEPLDFEDHIFTLVIPPLAVSTPAAYAAWDALGSATHHGPNDLEPAAIRVVPELARWRQAIADACGQPPVLAGSGATWFVHGEHSNAFAGLCDEGAEVVVARTVPA